MWFSDNDTKQFERSVYRTLAFAVFGWVSTWAVIAWLLWRLASYLYMHLVWV